MFSRLLLISCICIVIAVILYFFYWNRFIGFLIGRIVRLLYWGTEGPSIRIEIGSIHFSLLAGRILLKDLRYYSTNQTVKVVKGQIQWRYWIRRPTAEEDLNTIRSEEDQAQSPSLRCRIHISFQGFEWLLYNRSTAYDNIVSQMEGNTPTRPTSRSTEPRQSVSKSSRAGSASPFYPPSLVRTSRYVPRVAKKLFAWTRSQLPSLDPKDLLPLGIEVSKGAIILGNSSTPNLLVAEFQRSEGTFGIVEARSKYDQYRHSLSLKFHSALIRYARNDGYVDPMTSMGELVHGRIIQYSTLNRPSSYLSYRHFIKLWQQLGLSALTSKYSSDHRELHAKQQQATHRVQKSVKSTERPVAIGANYLNVEYAIERKILEAPLLELVYYVDVVGEVPFLPDGGGRSQPFDLGNGDVAPEWGFDVIITSGIIRYGPWADRQRVELQKTFFPPTYQNNEQTPMLRPGDKRLWTEMRIFIELRDSTTLHVPFREFSKDWQWDDQVDGMQRQRNRESAIIHLAVGDCSTIKYTLPMIVGPAGYEPSLEAHLDTITVTSSLNDIRLVVAESCRVRGEFPTPREWNAERTWSIAVFLRQPVLYLIRDHINMFIDLGKDWTAGPPSDYQRFIPMIYNFDLALHHYELNTYANDHNIIDKPLVRDENALVTLRGARLQTSVKVPSNTYRPDSTTIPFHIDVPDASVGLSLPRWHTMAAHAPKEGNSLASVSHLSVTGSYLYFADVREDNVEQLKLQFMAHGLSYKILGWSIRYFMVMRENYLGTFTHFTTLHEYLEKRKQNLPVGDPIHAKYREGKSNMLHVELLVSIENASLILPAGLPGYESAGPTEHEDVGIGACLYLTVPEVQLQLRLHDYYMDMSLNTDTLSGMILSDYPQRVSHSWIPPKIRNDRLLIDSLDITANRLFGPQPRTATYLCIWEIRVGRTKAVLSPAESRILLAAVTAFRLNFADLPNAPAEEFQPAADPDATFVKVSFGRMDVTWKAGPGAVVLNIPFGGHIDSNDLAGQYHRKVTSIRLPEVSMKALLSPSIEADRWLEAADVSLDISVDIYSSPRGLESISETQRSYMEEQDRLTGRARLLLSSLRGDIRALSKHRKMHYKGLYLPQPAFPELGRDTRHGRREQTTSDMQSQDMRYSNVAPFSESDEDQEISEADRDAHLARLRLANAVRDVVNEDDQNMTSGDESDNEDLTDVTSDSDWLESIEFTDDDESLFACYSRLTRHYTAPTLLHPASWEGSPFVIMKEYHPPEFANVAKQSPHHWKNLSHQVLPVQIDTGNLTSYRLKSRDGVQARMTPLVVRLLGSFEEETEEQPLSPELWIDSFLSTYLTEIFPRKSPGDSVTYFEISSPSVLLSFPQKISIADLRSMSSVDLDDETDLLCTVAVPHASLTGLHMSGFTSHLDVSCIGGFERLVIALQMLPIRRHPSSLHLEKQVFDFEASDFRVELIKGRLRLEWDHTATSIDHVGPENVIATFLSFREALSSLQSCRRRWNNYCSELGQIIVADTVTSSTNRAIIDPLSTIQHSYLVQQGKPRQLRTDTTFRFLFHLRNCLWHLGSEQKGKFHRLQNMEALNPNDFKSLLESRLSEVDQDSYQGHLSSLESFFSILRASQAQSTPRSRLPYSSLHMKFTSFSVLIMDPTSASPSKFDVTETSLSGFTREFETMQAFSAAALSQTSFQARSARKVTKTSVSAVLGDISLIVLPHLIRFTHHLLRVRRYLAVLTTSNLHKTVTPSQTSAPLPSLSNTEIAYALRSFKIQAAAQDLALEFVVLNTHGILTFLVGLLDDKGRRMNNSLLFSQVYLRARSLSDVVKENDQDVLASLELSGGKLHNASTQDSHLKVNQRLVFSLAALRFRVPRSALRLYRFADQWRADFLTEIEATMQALLGELQASSQGIPEQSRSLEILPSVEVQGDVTSLNISLQVMHGTWLSWEAYHAITYMNTALSLNSTCHFGFQVASMALSIWSKPVTPDVSLGTRVGIALPRVSITGQHSGGSIDTRILVDFIDVKVKPSHLDTLLAVQQKFGQDFNDLMTLIRETRAKQRVHQHETPSVKKSLSYSGFLKVRGFRMGFEGVSSILYLECSDVGGGLKNHADLVWDVKLLDLAFSLAPRTFIEHRHAMFDRNHCSAFVIVDFKVSAAHCKIADMTQKEIQVSITKIHAVMQPSSIGEIGDFIDHLQAEVLERKEQRALELAAFKEKAQNLLRTFEVGLRDSETATATPWFDQFDVNVSIQNVGFAFPLTHDEDLELPRPVSKDSYPVRAFLFSVRSIEFGFHRGESGRAVMKSFSFQFVSRFRQRVPDDYSGENHQTLNRLTYPEMKAYLRSMRSASFRRICIDADVDGFYLDLDSNIPSYIFSLVDVYHQGKARVERLSASMPRTSSPYTAISEEDIQKLYNTLPTANVLASMVFHSGKVRMYSESALRSYRSKQLSFTSQELSDEQVMAVGAEVFSLPDVSVWSEYQAAPAPHKFRQPTDAEPSLLMFKSTVHSSQNILRPTLLPFLTELVNHVETRLGMISPRTSIPSESLAAGTSALTPQAEEASSSALNVRISFSLRIDKSKLELTCQPDVNVIAGLHWESGGFVVNISPKAHTFTFTGAVGGLTVGLRHGFLSEDCLSLDARNLAFSVNVAKYGLNQSVSTTSISSTVDTEFHGVVRFSRLQDILCFKAVWLDRIPIFNRQPTTPGKAPPSSVSQPTQAPKSIFITAILARIRQITLEVDLGQSISTITLNLRETIVRTKLTEYLSEVFVVVAELSMNAKGNIAGYVHVPDCVFQTIRGAEIGREGEERQGRMLELRMTSGALVIALESDHQKLVRYRAEPLAIEVFDDWSGTQPATTIDISGRFLQLSFTVSSPEIVAVVTVGTIPKLMTYANKFRDNLNIQRQGASRESRTFRVALTPKPDNPLSAVAEAMLISARTRFKEADVGLSYVILQHMSLRLKLLRLIVFPRTMDDLEMAHFVGHDVRARLDRLVDVDSIPCRRDLRLSFSSMTISKFSQLGHPQSTDQHDIRDALKSLLQNSPEAIIVGLPSMTIHMVSEEKHKDDTMDLIYDFESKFVHKGISDSENIYITLNVALYSWLTVLRKNLAREMDQVKSANEWRALISSSAGASNGARKRVPEPLPLDAPSKRQTAMEPTSARTSPFSPTTALRPSPGELTRSLTVPHTPGRSPIAQSPTEPSTRSTPGKRKSVIYCPRNRHIERLTMRQLGEATPDVMHPFFMKKAGFNLEDSFPQYVHEYATAPLEEIMEVLLKLYSRQLLAGRHIS